MAISLYRLDKNFIAFFFAFSALFRTDFSLLFY